jgi:molybdopterin-containing oxidoreductase family iron-sulfur binding subunit
MVKYAMVIDLQKCVGCGACALACKNENNVQQEIYWAHYIKETEGKFPNVRYNYVPTLCNHCTKAPCVLVCPTQAMHKQEDNITMHDHEKCIGCRYCMIACPYGVIYFNDREAHHFWRSNIPTIEGGTPSPKEVTEKVNGEVLPYYNPARAETYAGIRPTGVVEKCTFCDHRVTKGELPYCVVACPSEARIFGDLDDPNSNVNHLLGKFQPIRLKEELGTEPNVFYIRRFNPSHHNEEVRE